MAVRREVPTPSILVPLGPKGGTFPVVSRRAPAGLCPSCSHSNFFFRANVTGFPSLCLGFPTFH